MRNSEQFGYTPVRVNSGGTVLIPQLQLTLTNLNYEAPVSGLVDSGATVNALPYSVGIELGAVWDPSRANLRLTGNLARYPASPLKVSAIVGGFAPVNLIFAWTQTDEASLILGQVNFFMEFDVCFYRFREMFEIRPRS